MRQQLIKQKRSQKAREWERIRNWLLIRNMSRCYSARWHTRSHRAEVVRGPVLCSPAMAQGSDSNDTCYTSSPSPDIQQVGAPPPAPLLCQSVAGFQVTWVILSSGLLLESSVCPGGAPCLCLAELPLLCAVHRCECAPPPATPMHCSFKGCGGRIVKKNCQYVRWVG